MEEHQLKELAYTIFFGACGKRSNAEHVQVMRAQLEVSSRSTRPSLLSSIKSDGGQLQPIDSTNKVMSLAVL